MGEIFRRDEAYPESAGSDARLLALLLVIFVLTLPIPGVINAADDAAQGAAMSQLLNDAALAGGALILANNYEE